MMDKNMINARILILSRAMDKTKEKHELMVAEESNTHLQDFIIWLRGYLDGEESKKGATQ